MSAVASHRRQRHASVAPGAECALGSPVPGLMQALSREPDVNIPNRQVSLNRYNGNDLSRAILGQRFIWVSFTKSSKKFYLNHLNLTRTRHLAKPVRASALACSAPITDERSAQRAFCCVASHSDRATRVEPPAPAACWTRDRPLPILDPQGRTPPHSVGAAIAARWFGNVTQTRTASTRPAANRPGRARFSRGRVVRDAEPDRSPACVFSDRSHRHGTDQHHDLSGVEVLDLS